MCYTDDAVTVPGWRARIVMMASTVARDLRQDRCQDDMLDVRPSLRHRGRAKSSTRGVCRHVPWSARTGAGGCYWEVQGYSWILNHPSPSKTHFSFPPTKHIPLFHCRRRTYRLFDVYSSFQTTSTCRTAFIDSQTFVGFLILIDSVLKFFFG